MIRIHEDDWGMRNLYPIGAWPEAAKEMQESIEFSDAHRSPGGYGWDEIRAIKAPPTTYADVGLTVRAATDALTDVMPRVRWFAATISGMIGSEKRDPYGSYENDALCFGVSADCFVKLDTDGELVRDIWFEARGNADEMPRLRAALEAIDGICPSFVADYWASAIGPVADGEFIERYFESLTA